MLIGNKSDLEDRVVEESAARQLAETLGIRYFETSAKTGENVAEAVEVLLEQVSIDLANSNHAICKIVGFLLWNVQDYSFYCAICKIAICYHAVIKVLASYGAVLEKAISYCAICKMAVSCSAVCKITVSYGAICKIAVCYCAFCKITVSYQAICYHAICMILAFYRAICRTEVSYCATSKIATILKITQYQLLIV